MKKVNKGDYGYIRYEKKKRLLITVALFLIPLAAFLAAFLITGTKKNIITVIAMVGCLPACRALVNMIMMWMQKPMDKKVYKKIREHEGNLEVTYETYLTTYEKSVFVESFAICGNKVIGYTSHMDGSTQFIEDHVRGILKQNGYKVEVKVFKELKTYLERMDYLNAHKQELEQNMSIRNEIRAAMEQNISFKPDERYPDLSRDQLIKHTILAISL